MTNVKKTTKKNSDTGAGANAKANMMNFVGSGTLAELVWSPQTGLNIKFADNKPCIMPEEGPTETRRLDAQNEVVKISSCTSSHNKGAAGTLCQHVFQKRTTSNGNDSRSESRSPLKVEPMMQCEPHENDRKHEAESHGSMESCRSANLSTKRKKICSVEQQFILGRKRIKKQADEYATKTDHSFMNWISNMLKGFKSRNINDQRIGVSNETHSLESKEKGFQNVFQSLFSPETITRIENKSIGSSVIAKRRSEESVVYNITNVGKEAPKGMFDTIRGLRLSRTDIHKWMNSKSSVAQLDGFFLRLRVTKPEERAEGSRYYVAYITGLQWETQTPLKDMKQSIRVKVRGVECFVESQHISNCDFVEDELIAWWQKTSEIQRIPFVKDLKSKLAVRRTLRV
ncbi:putative Plus-3 domain, Plus3-like superfamily protein [Helianthus anomalus]